MRAKQRYKCKDCGLNFVDGDQRRGKNIAKQRIAIHLYLEGMGFRAIGRVVDVSNVTVLNWIRKAGEQIKAYHDAQEAPKQVEIIELDELWHFVGKKKRKLWIWVALDRAGGRILDFVTGSRQASTGKRLWEKIKNIACNQYSTDHFVAYRSIISGNHVASKKETHIIESSNANVRHYLARFRRKTKCYSKSEELVVLSLYLLIYKQMALSIY